MVLLLIVCGILTIGFVNKSKLLPVDISVKTYLSLFCEGMQREESNKHALTDNVITKRNEAYEITVLARQRVVMKENQAYEQVYKNNIM